MFHDHPLIIDVHSIYVEYFSFSWLTFSSNCICRHGRVSPFLSSTATLCIDVGLSWPYYFIGLFIPKALQQRLEGRGGLQKPTMALSISSRKPVIFHWSTKAVDCSLAYVYSGWASSLVTCIMCVVWLGPCVQMCNDTFLFLTQVTMDTVWVTSGVDQCVVGRIFS